MFKDFSLDFRVFVLIFIKGVIDNESSFTAS